MTDETQKRLAGGLELWGGVECTVNRVGDGWLDQFAISGHRERDADIAAIAALGIRALRYPVLWEHVSPDTPDRQDWSLADRRLPMLRTSGINPVVGLIHHGSGPRYTHLLDPGFAAGLAAHAARVAERFPWVRDWTPVNEPLTTARFACLYGHWYPHTRDETSFWTALLNQIDAVRLSMRAIRAVNPQARLIQTDDLGRTYATAQLRRQAGHDNIRRWMGWDLLFGRVGPGHPFWRRLVRLGLQSRLETILADPCPPDIVGVNHYLTSDRFLDHRTERYPAHVIGGNGRQRYADVEAVRVLNPSPDGFRTALAEAWHRYEAPLAITEVHNGCTREEQMRWTRDAWNSARELREQGVDVRAVTAWSLLGSHDWNSLLTVQRGHYEVGAFDVRGGSPRPTAMVPMLAALAKGQTPDHPLLGGDGWWRRPIRLEHPPVRLHGASPHMSVFPRTRRARHAETRPLLITGATGTLGRAIARACALRDIPHVLTSRADLDLHDPASVQAALERVRPWAVVNAAGWVRVDDAEHEPDGCLRANHDGAVQLAAACAERDIPFVTFSSDLVFDGRANRPYRESDETKPLNVYGLSKARADKAILSNGGRAVVVRPAAFFSPHDEYNFAWAVARTLRGGQPFHAAADYSISPTYVPDLVATSLDLLIDEAWGLWHVTNGEGLSWSDFGKRVAKALDLDAALVEPVPGAQLGWRARRPRQSVMVSEHGLTLPPLDEAVQRFAKALAA